MQQCEADAITCFFNSWGIVFIPFIVLFVMFFGGAMLLDAISKFRFNRIMQALDKRGVETEGMIIGKDVFRASRTSYTNLPVPRTRFRQTTYDGGMHRISYIYTAGGYRFEAEAHVSPQDWVNLDREAKVIVKYLPDKPNVSRLKDYQMYA